MQRKSEDLTKCPQPVLSAHPPNFPNQLGVIERVLPFACFPCRFCPGRTHKTNANAPQPGGGQMQLRWLARSLSRVGSGAHWARSCFAVLYKWKPPDCFLHLILLSYYFKGISVLIDNNYPSSSKALPMVKPHLRTSRFSQAVIKPGLYS